MFAFGRLSTQLFCFYFIIAAVECYFDSVSDVDFTEAPDHNTTDTSITCSQLTLLKCGHSFMRAVRLTDYTFDDDKLRTEVNSVREAVQKAEEDTKFNEICLLRTAFYNCLTKNAEKSCFVSVTKRRVTPRFKKRLAKTLWATRTCVLAGCRTASGRC